MQRTLYRWEDGLFYSGIRRRTIWDAWCYELSLLFGLLGDALSPGRRGSVTAIPRTDRQ